LRLKIDSIGVCVCLLTLMLTSSKPDVQRNKLRLSKVLWAEEWIKLSRVGTGGGLLWMR